MNNTIFSSTENYNLITEMLKAYDKGGEKATFIFNGRTLSVADACNIIVDRFYQELLPLVSRKFIGNEILAVEVTMVYGVEKYFNLPKKDRKDDTKQNSNSEKSNGSVRESNNASDDAEEEMLFIFNYKRLRNYINDERSKNTISAHSFMKLLASSAATDWYRKHGGKKTKDENGNTTYVKKATSEDSIDGLLEHNNESDINLTNEDFSNALVDAISNKGFELSDKEKIVAAFTKLFSLDKAPDRLLAHGYRCISIMKTNGKNKGGIKGEDGAISMMGARKLSTLRKRFLNDLQDSLNYVREANSMALNCAPPEPIIFTKDDARQIFHCFDKKLLEVNKDTNMKFKDEKMSLEYSQITDFAHKVSIAMAA